MGMRRISADAKEEYIARYSSDEFARRESTQGRVLGKLPRLDKPGQFIGVLDGSGESRLLNG
jgi:hypothetical protein